MQSILQWFLQDGVATWLIGIITLVVTILLALRTSPKARIIMFEHGELPFKISEREQIGQISKTAQSLDFNLEAALNALTSATPKDPRQRRKYARGNSRFLRKFYCNLNMMATLDIYNLGDIVTQPLEITLKVKQEISIKHIIALDTNIDITDSIDTQLLAPNELKIKIPFINPWRPHKEHIKLWIVFDGYKYPDWRIQGRNPGWSIKQRTAWNQIILRNSRNDSGLLIGIPFIIALWWVFQAYNVPGLLELADDYLNLMVYNWPLISLIPILSLFGLFFSMVMLVSFALSVALTVGQHYLARTLAIITRNMDSV